jgi:hypothetical protein
LLDRARLRQTPPGRRDDQERTRTRGEATLDKLALNRWLIEPQATRFSERQERAKRFCRETVSLQEFTASCPTESLRSPRARDSHDFNRLIIHAIQGNGNLNDQEREQSRSWQECS